VSRIRRPLLAAVATAPLAALAVESACSNAGTGGALVTTTSAPAPAQPLDAGTSSSPIRRVLVDDAGQEWVPVANTPFGCPLERLANASSIRAFTWEACAGIPNCERVVRQPPLAGLELRTGVIDEEPEQTRVTFVATTAGASYVFFATRDGWLADAYRVSETAPLYCGLFAGSSRGGRYGVALAVWSQMPLWYGGVLHSFGDPAPPTPFELKANLGYGPNQGTITMGTTRWLWMSAGLSLISLSTAAGGDPTLVAAAFVPDAAIPTFHVTNADTNGSTFLFGNTMATPDGGLTSVIAATDGKSAPKPLIVPADGSLYDYPAFAGSYVAWFKGIGFTDANTYNKVELWASQYSPDATQLAPFKVDDFVTAAPGKPQGATRLYGAAGRVAAYIGEYTAAAVWNLASKRKTLLGLPSDVGLIDFLGISSKYVWVAAGPGGGAQNVITTFVRYALP
jgi:hypothetical protein